MKSYTMKQKENEIREFCLERLEEIADYEGFEDFSEMDISDLHNQIFNEDYYIVGYYQAEQWLGTDTFSAIAEIKHYEEMNFGESHTDFSSSEAVVNMYVYILGEEVIQDCFDEVVEKLGDDQLSLDLETEEAS
jgi:fido (protein-threonine AMPylation protein)